MEGFVGQPFFDTFTVGDVGEGAHKTDDLPGFVALGMTQQLHHPPSAIGPHNRALQVEGLAIQTGHGQVILPLGKIFVGQGRQLIGQGEGARVGIEAIDAEHFLRPSEAAAGQAPFPVACVGDALGFLQAGFGPLAFLQFVVGLFEGLGLLNGDGQLVGHGTWPVPCLPRAKPRYPPDLVGGWPDSPRVRHH